MKDILRLNGREIADAIGLLMAKQGKLGTHSVQLFSRTENGVTQFFADVEFETTPTTSKGST